MKTIAKFLRDDSGATAIEYGLIAALIAVAIIAAASMLGGQLGNLFNNIGNRLDAPPTSGHVGMNGDGFLPPSHRNGQNQRHGQNRGGSGSGGGGRRGGRRRGRRGGSGGGGSRTPRGNHDTQ